MRLLIGLTLVPLIGCQQTCQKLEPITIVHTVAQHEISLLPSAFPSITTKERQQDWAKELLIGDMFAHEVDLYRAITCYRRAIALIPDDCSERRQQLAYDIVLCYYLGHKYQDAIRAFEDSILIDVGTEFPAFNNLLLILYDSYRSSGRCEEADVIYKMIEGCSPETASDLSLLYFLKEGDLPCTENEICTHRNKEAIEPLLCCYKSSIKSPAKARLYNAVLPGSGYYYVGQKKSAMTSFIINALFTAAAYQFFHNGYYAAGAITTSLELGWYLGGINGAGIEAQEYNRQLYDAMARRTLTANKLFPVLIFETAF